jgi:hypothetical protein
MHLFLQVQFATAIDFAVAAYPRKAWQALHLSLTFSSFKYQPLVAHRSPPCNFCSDCNLQNAIDFAELRMRCCGAEAWSEWWGLDFRCNPASRIAAHRANFWRCNLQGAIDFAELRSEAELEAWSEMECRIAHRSSPCKIFKQLFLQVHSASCN